MRVLRSGERAVLLELDDLVQVLGLYEALRREYPRGVEELVPAARTLLVRFDPRLTTVDALSAGLIRHEIAVRQSTEGDTSEAFAPSRAPDEVEVQVRYVGQDLEDVAGLAGLSVDEVITRHSGASYTCGFCGFAPGFAYLTGLDPALHVPRRQNPRTAVPAGAVAIADEFTAVYPRESPGGWRIIGHTDLQVWDLDRDPPTLLPPATRVRFVAVDA